MEDSNSEVSNSSSESRIHMELALVTENMNAEPSSSRVRPKVNPLTRFSQLNRSRCRHRRRRAANAAVNEVTKIMSESEQVHSEIKSDLVVLESQINEFMSSKRNNPTEQEAAHEPFGDLIQELQEKVELYKDLMSKNVITAIRKEVHNQLEQPYGRLLYQLGLTLRPQPRQPRLSEFRYVEQTVSKDHGR